MASKRFFLFSARDAQPHSDDAVAAERAATRYAERIVGDDDRANGWDTQPGQLAASGYFHTDSAWGGVPLETTPMDYAFGRYGPR